MRNQRTETKQLNSVLTVLFLILGLLILVATTLYTKLMIEYETQNAMEAFYAINGFTLVIFSLIIICKIKLQSRQVEQANLLEIEDMKRKIITQETMINICQ